MALSKYIQIILALCWISFSYAEDSVLDAPVSTDNFPGCVVGSANYEQIVYHQQAESSILLQADTVSGYSSSYALANGDVSIAKSDQLFLSDWALMEKGSNHFTAGDHVTFTQGADIINATWVDYYFDLNTGVFSDAVAQLSKRKLNVAGKLIEIQDKNHYSAYQGGVTSCNINNPLWILKAESFQLDYVSNVAEAHNATFYIESIPVFYSPYFSFPLSGRKSGFLLPNIGGSTNGGFTAGLPFYWNMAPNYDMTIQPIWLSNQGVMLTDEFRYMTESGSGRIYTEQVPSNFSSNGDYRYYWHLDDVHTLYPNVVAGYQFNQVSDNNYFNDFGNFYAVTDNINLEKSAFITYTPRYATMGVRVQGFQTIQPDGLPPVSRIYSMLPQVYFNLNPFAVIPSVSFSLSSQMTNFSSEYMQTAQRYYLYPSITYSAIDAVYGYSKLKFGYSMAYYDIQPLANYQVTDYIVNRHVPIFSVDNGLYFDRSASMFNGSFTQTIEPRVYYLYIPEVNQSMVPLFDTAPVGSSLSQLFSENRFVGIDRINMANDVTVGATTRLINDADGVEQMNLGVGYRYYITPENLFLYGNYTQYQQLFTPVPDLITELNNNWGDGLKTNVYYQFDTTAINTDAYGVGMSYNPEVGKVVNAKFTYQYNLPLLYYAWQPGQTYAPASYENQYAVNMSIQWPLTVDNRWSVLGQVNYDFTVNSLLNGLAGVEYSIGCFGIRFVYENYVSNLINRNSAYFIQFNFKGLGSLGTDPTGDLSSNIQGYSSQRFMQ